MPKLSVVITTRNHAAIIERTLKSVAFADEIVVVDVESDDNTLEIVHSYTDQVFPHPNPGYVEPVRNFSITKASGDWILILDADEEIPPSLHKTIEAIVSAPRQAELPDCFYLPRKNLIFGRWIEKTGWWPDYQLRLFRKGHVEWSDQIHSVPITKGEVKELPAQEKLAILHHNYQTVEQFIERLNRYSNIQAKERESSTKNIEPSMIFKSFRQEFFQRFFAQEGYQDGTHGLSLSLLQAMSEAATEMKVWQAHGFQPAQERRAETMQQLQIFKRDLAFWLADTQVKQTRGPKQLYWRVRRKFKL